MANQEIDSLSLEISIKGLDEKDVKNLESLANSIAKLQRNLKKLETNKLQEIDIPQNIRGVTGIEMPLVKQTDTGLFNEAENFDAVFKDVEVETDKIATNTERAASNIGKINTNVPKIKTSLKGANDEAKKTDKNFKKPKKQLGEVEKQLRRIKTIGLVKLIRGAMQSFIRGMGEGYKNLALFDSSFNETLSTLKTAKTQTFNSLALITAPIVSVITPAVTMISNALIEVSNRVSQITASLKGATTYTKVNSKYAEDYAKSMQKAQTFSFDTFNSLDIQNDNMFETEELDEAADKSTDIYTIFSDLKDTFEDVRVFLTDIVKLAGGFLKDNIGNIKEIISQSKEFIDTIKNVLSKINFEKALKNITTNLSKVIGFVGIILDLVEKILEDITPLIDTITSDLSPALLDMFISVISPIFDIIKAISPIITTLIELIVSVLTPILKVISPIISTIGSIVSRIGEMIAWLVENFLTTQIVDALKDITTLLQPIIEVISWVLKAVGEIFNMIDALLHGDWKGLAESFGKFVASIGIAILKFFAGVIDFIVNGVISAINFIIANEAIKKIVEWFGGEWNGITWRSNLVGSVPSYANGGIVGELWQMNEYGNPEMLYSANGNSTAVITQEQLARAFENAIFNTGLLDAITDSKNIYIDGKNIAQSKNFKSELNRTNPNLNIR